MKFLKALSTAAATAAVIFSGASAEAANFNRNNNEANFYSGQQGDLFEGSLTYNSNETYESNDRQRGDWHVVDELDISTGYNTTLDENDITSGTSALFRPETSQIANLYEGEQVEDTLSLRNLYAGNYPRRGLVAQEIDINSDNSFEFRDPSKIDAGATGTISFGDTPSDAMGHTKVPEPSTYAGMILGGGMIGWKLFQRRRNQ